MICRFFVWLTVFSLASRLHAQNLDKLKSKDRITLNGGVNYSAMLSPQVMQFEGNVHAPFMWVASGNLNLSILDVSVPLTFSYSNQQSSFSNISFNRFGATPQYKWAKLHVGYSNLQLSTYSLNGIPFLGGGFELRPGNWNFTGMCGELNPRSRKETMLVQDSLHYKRLGFGAKVAYAKEGKSIEANLFHAFDKPNRNERLANYVGQAAENSSAGIKSQFKIGHYFMLDGEYSISLMDRYRFIKDEISSSKTKSTYLSDYAMKSETYKAFNVGFGFAKSVYSLKLQMEHVDPNYTSLGSFFITNDFRNYTLNPAIKLFKKKFILHAKIGLQQNNLDNLKTSTSQRRIASGHVSYTFKKGLSASALYSNFINITRINPINEPGSSGVINDANGFVKDSVALFMITKNASINLQKSFGNKSFKQQISGSLNYVESSTFNVSSNNLVLISGNISHNVTVTKQKINFVFSVSGSENALPNRKQSYLGPNLMITKSFMSQKLNVSVGSSYNLVYTDASHNGDIYIYRVNGSYNSKLAQKNYGKISISLGANYLRKNIFDTALVENLQGTANLAYSF